MMAVIGQHTVRAGESIPLPTYGLGRRQVSSFPCKNGIVRRAGKSIMRGHQMTADGLQL